MREGHEGRVLSSCSAAPTAIAPHWVASCARAGVAAAEADSGIGQVVLRSGDLAPRFSYSQSTMIIPILALLVSPLVNDVIFNDGEVHNLTQADVQPTDNIIVLPLNSFNGTVVRVLQQAVIQSLTAGNLCITQITGNSRVLGDVTVQTGGRTLISSTATIMGDLYVEGDAEANFVSGTLEGNASVAAMGELRLQDHVLGDVDAQGECFVSGTIEGTATASGFGALVATPGVLRGPVVIEGSAQLRSFGGRFESSVTVGGDATSQLFGNFFNETELLGQLTVRDSATLRVPGSIVTTQPFIVEDSATLRIVVLSANVPFGAISGSSGVITGFASPGVPFSLAFSKSAGATVIVENSEPTFGSAYCFQPEPNSTGQRADISASGSRFADDRNLVLTVTDAPPHTFGFFFVGTEPAAIALNESLVCVGGNVGRYIGPGQITNSGLDGSFSVAVSTDPVPGNPGSTAVAGDQFYFQSWFRDIAATGATYRFSEALSITFL